MAAVSLTDPLCKPCSYRSHFKGNAYLFNKMLFNEMIIWLNMNTCFLSRCLQLRCVWRSPWCPFSWAVSRWHWRCCVSAASWICWSELRSIRWDTYTDAACRLCVCLNIQTSNLHLPFQENLKQDSSPEESESFKRHGKLKTIMVTIITLL